MTHTIQVESLLAESDWLRGLARHLVDDQATADDLFQDTVHAALRQREDIRGPVRPWLAGVARRLAKRSQRTAIRTRRREGVAARDEALPSAAEAVARFDDHRRVVQAVQELAPTMREAVVLRYFEGLPPREIAKRLNVPVETAKSRVKRGLAELRERLDAEYGDRSTWMSALLPLVRLDGVATSVAAPAAGVSGRALVAVLVAALGFFTWFFWPQSNATPPAGTMVAGIGAITVEESNGPAEVQAAAAPSRELLPEREPTPAGNGPKVLVVDAATGEPRAGVRVHFMDRTMRDEDDPRVVEAYDAVDRGELSEIEVFRRLMAFVISDRDGIAQLPEGVRLHGAILAIDDEFDGLAMLQGTAVKGAEPIRLELHAAVQVPVVVRDEEGQPIAGVAVALMGMRGFESTSWTDAKGEASLRAMFAGTLFPDTIRVVVREPLAQPVAAAIEKTALVEGLSERVGLTIPQTPDLTVSVVDLAGQPIREGSIMLFERTVDAKEQPHKRRFKVLASAELKDGMATFDRMGADVTAIVTTPGWAQPIEAELRAPSESGTTVRIEPPRGVDRVALRLQHPDGTSRGRERVEVWVGNGRVRSAVSTDQDGRLWIDRVVSGSPAAGGAASRTVSILEWTGYDRSKNSSWKSVIEVEAAGTVDAGNRVPDAEPLLIAGRLVDEQGHGIQGAFVRLSERPLGEEPLSFEPNSSSVRTNEAGEFTFYGDRPEREIRLVAEDPDRGTVTTDPIFPGQRDLVIKLARAGRVEVSVPGCADDRAVGLSFTLQPNRPGAEAIDGGLTNGEIVFPDLPAGRYEFRVTHAEGERPAIVVPAEVRGGELTTLPPVDLSVLRSVELTFVDKQGTAVADFMVMARFGATYCVGETDAAGKLRVFVANDGFLLRSASGMGFDEVEVLRDRQITVDRSR